jgi:hypothetical protein
MEPTTTEAVTLAKALSIKNRLAGRLTQAKTNVETYNSVSVGLKDDEGHQVDVRAEFDRYKALQAGLVTVKAAIALANAAIYHHVLTLGEKKALIQWLNSLNTKQGTEPGFGGFEHRYAATFTKPEVLEKIRKLESEIDQIQDQLNQYNASTTINLPLTVIELTR